MFNSLKKSLESKVTLSDKASVVVDVMQPGMVKGWWEGQYRVLFTMWETDKLPYSMAELLPQFNQILVPCKHNLELYQKYHPNVSYVPLGVDTDVWFPREKKPAKKPFRFLAGGSHWRRKGLDIVVEAFRRLDRDAELHIKCKTDTIGGIPEINHPNIFFHTKVMTVEEEQQLYTQANCYLAISRGEGWGLMPLQAIHRAIPTIISDTSGHKEFKDHAHAVIPTQPVPCDEPILYKIGNWDEPDLDTLVVEMRNIIDQWSKTKPPQPTPYTWDNSANLLLEAIPKGKQITPTKWLPPEEALIEVQALRKIDAHIGPHHIIMDKGETRAIPINAKNVLKENGAIILV